jgi:hypothetical protein
MQRTNLPNTCRRVLGVRDTSLRDVRHQTMREAGGGLDPTMFVCAKIPSLADSVGIHAQLHGRPLSLALSSSAHNTCRIAVTNTAKTSRVRFPRFGRRYSSRGIACLYGSFTPKYGSGGSAGSSALSAKKDASRADASDGGDQEDDQDWEETDTDYGNEGQGLEDGDYEDEEVPHIKVLSSHSCIGLLYLCKTFCRCQSSYILHVSSAHIRTIYVHHAAAVHSDNQGYLDLGIAFAPCTHEHHSTHAEAHLIPCLVNR